MPYKIAEEEAAYQKDYYEKNKEAIAAYKKAYNEKNKEAIAAYEKAYREENKESIAAYKKAYYQKNKEYLNKRRRMYNKANKEYVASLRREVNKKHYEANRDYYAELNLIRKYGITLEDKERMLNDQGNNCKICCQDFSADVNPVVDHCHASGVVRGLLCNRCNVGLGMFQDNPLELVKAIEYLKEQGEEAPPEGN